MYNAMVELAERFDSLDQADLDNRLDQLTGFHPAIGWGNQGTEITISLKADTPAEVDHVARKLIDRKANPNQVAIVKTTVMTTADFDRMNGIDPVLDPVLEPPVD
jgi:hypothetical protein